MTNISQIMKQAKEMQEKMAEVQKKLKKQRWKVFLEEELSKLRWMENTI